MGDDTHIRVSGQNWKYLNSMKEPGESFDDALSRLIDEHDHMAFVGGEPNEP